MHCPACNDDLRSKAPALASPSTVTCAGCGLRFACPMEAGTPEWYEQSGIYSEEGAPLDEDSRYRWVLEQLGGGGTLLDLGCGSGTFLRAAEARGFDAKGVDIQPQLVKRAKEVGCQARCMELELALLEVNADYDVITAFDVIEHLADPGIVATRMLARLRRGGQAVVSVPRADRYPQVFDPVIDSPPHHLTLWTPDALKALFRNRGARSVKVHELPLTTQDLFLHHLWAKYGHHGMNTTRWDGLVKRGLSLKTAALRACGRARGHTLIAIATGAHDS